jgi:hypothetical protein
MSEREREALLSAIDELIAAGQDLCKGVRSARTDADLEHEIGRFKGRMQKVCWLPSVLPVLRRLF